MTPYEEFCNKAVEVNENEFQCAFRQVPGDDKVNWLINAYNQPKVDYTPKTLIGTNPAYLWANALPRPYEDFCNATGTSPDKEQFDKALKESSLAWLIACVNKPSKLTLGDIQRLPRGVIWAHCLGHMKAGTRVL